jgi:iron complex transport system ATP-binding protein
MLEARSLFVNYGQADILHGVDVSVERAGFVGVIGPNGSGKSTLLKTLAGLVQPKSGEVFFAGRPVNSYGSRERARRLAVVPALTVPAFSFSVREVVAMGRTPHLGRFAAPNEADEAAVEEALALAGLAGLRQRPVDELSSGEWQRTIIARALAQRPEALLLDEPTAHLDLGHQARVFEMLAEQNQSKGVVVLAICHDLNLAAEYCQRLVLISEGRVLAQGAPAEVLSEKYLCAAYGPQVRVRENPLSGRPLILLKRGAPVS